MCAMGGRTTRMDRTAGDGTGRGGESIKGESRGRVGRDRFARHGPFFLIRRLYAASSIPPRMRSSVPAWSVRGATDRRHSPCRPGGPRPGAGPDRGAGRLVYYCICQRIGLVQRPPVADGRHASQYATGRSTPLAKGGWWAPGMHQRVVARVPCSTRVHSPERASHSINADSDLSSRRCP